MDIHARTAPMEWDLAIERHRAALLRILAALIAFLPEGDATSQITRRLHSAILFVLRPAESAVRRLIIVAATLDRGVKTTASPLRGGTRSEADRVGVSSAKRPPDFKLVAVNFGLARALGTRALFSQAGRSAECNAAMRGNGTFPLTDTLKRFGENSGPKTRKNAAPNIWFPGAPDRVIGAPKPDPHAEDLINAAPVMRRLKRLQKALTDIPGQASRLLHSRRKPQRLTPLRAGFPPGYRRRHQHEIDDILQECQWLARKAMDARTLPPPTWGGREGVAGAGGGKFPSR